MLRKIIGMTIAILVILAIAHPANAASEETVELGAMLIFAGMGAVPGFIIGLIFFPIIGPIGGATLGGLIMLMLAQKSREVSHYY